MAAQNVAGPAWAPAHPGELWREDILPALGLSVSDAARRMAISRQALHNVLGERTAVTAEMALRFGRLCGRDGSLWLRMQQARDLWLAERELHDVLARIEPVRTAA